MSEKDPTVQPQDDALNDDQLDSVAGGVLLRFDAVEATNTGSTSTTTTTSPTRQTTTFAEQTQAQRTSFGETSPDYTIDRTALTQSLSNLSTAVRSGN